MSKVQNISFFIIFLSIIGFALNFVWEYFQCGPFFIHRYGEANIQSMVKASLGDLSIVWGIFLVMVLIKRSFFWIKDAKMNSFILTIIFSLLVSILVERWGLMTGRWSYTSINPVLPQLNISVLPLLQMILITPLTFYFSKKISNRFNIF